MIASPPPLRIPPSQNRDLNPCARLGRRLPPEIRFAGSSLLSIVSSFLRRSLSPVEFLGWFKFSPPVKIALVFDLQVRACSWGNCCFREHRSTMATRKFRNPCAIFFGASFVRRSLILHRWRRLCSNLRLGPFWSVSFAARWLVHL